MERFVIISGCSGGGKSTLLEALRRRGHAVVEEPGRRIVGQEVARNGSALPWIDGVAFARRLIELSLADRSAAQILAAQISATKASSGWVFFDRGLIDAAAALQHLTAEPGIDELRHAHRYNRHVFLTPPWPEIYETDRERRHGLTEAIAEYDRLREIYPRLGYVISILPKTDVESRADFVIATLEADLRPFETTTEPP